MKLRTAGRTGAATFVACLLVLAGACGSGGGGSASAEGPAGGSDEIYDVIVGTLDNSYEELSRPPVDFENLERVKDHAFERLSDRAFDFPTGTSYSLSVLSDRVAIYVNCEGVEKRGDWEPDA